VERDVGGKKGGAGRWCHLWDVIEAKEACPEDVSDKENKNLCLNSFRGRRTVIIIKKDN